MSAADAEVAGITDSFAILLTSLNINPDFIRIIIIMVGMMFIYTMVANIVSWSFGVNSVAKYSADDGGLPAIFSKTNKDGVPHMASIMNGVVASIIVIIGIILGEVSETASNLFWTFFSLSLITLLISYIPLFLAFLKLRKIDKTKRVYEVPGNNFVIGLFTWVPFVLLVLSIIFTLFGDFTSEYISGNIPLIVGVIVSFIIEEILVSKIKEDKKTSK